MGKLTPSSRRTPCPVCGRTKDGDCRIGDDGLVLCHGNTDHRRGAVVLGDDGQRYAFLGIASDGRCGEFRLDRPMPSAPSCPPVQAAPATGEVFYTYSATQRIRRHGEGKGKRFTPQHLKDGQWIWAAGDDPWPCYGSITPPVAIETEGEKCVDALQAQGIPAITHPGHDHSEPSCIARYQALKAAGITTIYYVADHDETGESKAEKCQQYAEQAGIELHIIPAAAMWPDVPKGGSVDDMPAEQLRELLTVAMQQAIGRKPKANSKPAFAKLTEELQRAIDDEVSGPRLNQLFLELSHEYGIHTREVREQYEQLEAILQAEADAAKQGDYIRTLTERAKERETFKLTDALPRNVARAVSLLHANLQTDNFLSAAVVLAAASGCFKAGTQIRGDNRTFTQPPFIWLAIVGEGSDGKSAIYETLAKDVMTSVWEEYDQMSIRRQNDWDAVAATADGKKTQAPPPYHHDMGNATIEAITKFIANNHSAGLPASIMRDELSGVFLGVGQYKGGGKAADAEKGFYCSLYDGRIESELRIDRGVTTVRGRVQVAMLGGLQPGVFAAIRDVDDPIGLLARPLYCTMYMDRYKGNDGRDVDYVDIAEAQQTLKAFYLACLTQPPLPTLVLCPQAMAELNTMREGEFYERQQLPLPAHKRINGKKAGQILRMAGILHMAHRATGDIPLDCNTVSIDHFHLARQMVETMHAYAIAAETRIAASQLNNTITSAADMPQRIARFAAKQGDLGFSVATFRRDSLTGKRQRAAWSHQAIKAICDQLLATGHLVTRPTRSRNGSHRYFFASMPPA